MQRYQAGDAAAFEALFARYNSRILQFLTRFSQSESPEDLSQEVWSRAAAKLPQLREAAAFPAWLYSLARHVGIDAVRARPPQHLVIDDSLQVEDHSTRPDKIVESREAQRLVRKAFACLPRRQRQALYLREVQEQTYEEIAVALGTSRSAVETLLFRARNALGRQYVAVRDGVTGSLSCRRAAPALSALIDGELAEERKDQLESHLDACPRCQTRYRALRSGRRAARAVLLLPPTFWVRWLATSTSPFLQTASLGSKLAAIAALPKAAAVSVIVGLGATAMVVSPADVPERLLVSPAAPAAPAAGEPSAPAVGMGRAERTVPAASEIAAAPRLGSADSSVPALSIPPPATTPAESLMPATLPAPVEDVPLTPAVQPVIEAVEQAPSLLPPPPLPLPVEDVETLPPPPEVDLPPPPEAIEVPPQVPPPDVPLPGDLPEVSPPPPPAPEVDPDLPPAPVPDPGGVPLP